MTDLLPVSDAAELAGVPEHQLRCWAFDRNGGPRNIGTRVKPLYRAEDVEAWREAMQASRSVNAPQAHRSAG